MSPQGRADLRALKGPGRRRRQAPKTSSQNYEYDEIGNLVRDYSEQIEEIVWNVQGKVQEVRFEAGKAGPDALKYEYDPMGNRLAKKKLYVDGPVDIRSEGQYYVRDPQGNVLAVYQFNEENIALVDDKDSLYLEELHLYGSARLGILKKALALRYRDESGTVGLPAGSLLKTTLAQSSYQQLELGRRRYELSNHLGNVLATLSDKSLGQDSSQTGQADYYLAQVSSASLYYPFGWEMPGRKFVSGEGYRFGFNGKEDDRDWGTQNIQDYGFRLYNPSIGKFLSVDPLSPDYPELTCYQFASNTPIQAIDLDGLEGMLIINSYNQNGSKSRITIITAGGINLNASRGGVGPMSSRDVLEINLGAPSGTVLPYRQYPNAIDLGIGTAVGADENLVLQQGNVQATLPADRLVPKGGFTFNIPPDTDLDVKFGTYQDVQVTTESLVDKTYYESIKKSENFGENILIAIGKEGVVGGYMNSSYVNSKKEIENAIGNSISTKIGAEGGRIDKITVRRNTKNEHQKKSLESWFPEMQSKLSKKFKIPKSSIEGDFSIGEDFNFSITIDGQRKKTSKEKEVKVRTDRVLNVQ